MQDVFNKVVEVICDICDNVEKEDCSEGVNLIEDLGIDSLDFLDVTYDIDKAFGVKVPVEEWMEKINEGQNTVEDFFLMKNYVKNVEALIGQN